MGIKNFTKFNYPLNGLVAFFAVDNLSKCIEQKIGKIGLLS
jgi:hypothetical protein